MNKIDLLNIARNTKKATKAEQIGALNQLTKLLSEQQLPEEPSQGVINALATLYTPFISRPPRAPKTSFDWVAKAMGKGDVREALNYVWELPNGHTVATNGHRLHLVESEPMGGSPIAKDKKQEVIATNNIHFVKYEGLFSTRSDWTPLEQIATKVVAVTEQHHTLLELTDTLTGVKTYVNKQYWDDATGYGFPHVSILGPTDLIILEGATLEGDIHKALIMPFRYDPLTHE